MYMSDNDLVFTLRAVADSQAGSQQFANDLGNAMKAINASVLQVSQAVQQQTQFLQQNATTQQAVTQATQTAATTVVDYTSKIDKLRNSLDPLAKANSALASQTDLLHKAMDAGNISTDEFTSLLTKAQAAHKAASEAAGKHGQTIDALGMSLGETLRHGRALLDEMSAGRWKSFDGSLINILAHIGAANLEFAGAVGIIAALAAPFLVLGAAMGMGALELEKMHATLILTNGAAGTTTDTLRQMATAIGNTGVNTGAAKEALMDLAASGKFTAGNIQGIADVAASLEQSVGTPVKDTVKQFEELAKSPVEASQKLNEQYHYLTEAVFEQIEALVKHGDQVDAVNLAEDTYKTAMQQRADEIYASLGTIERGWITVKNAASMAWNAMLNLGKPATIQDQLAEVNAKIQAATKDTLGDRAVGMGLGADVNGSLVPNAGDGADLKALQMQQQDLQHKLSAQETTAAVKALDAADQQASITAAKAIEQLELRARGTEKLTTRLESFHNQLKELQKTNPNSALLNPDTIKEVDAWITKTSEVHVPKGKKPPSMNGLNNQQVGDELKGPADDIKEANDAFKNVMQEQSQLYQTHQITIDQFYANTSKAIDDHTGRMAADYADEYDMLVKDLARHDLNAQEKERIAQKLKDLQSAQRQMDQDDAHEQTKNSDTRVAALAKEATAIENYAIAMQKSVQLTQDQSDAKVAQVGEGSEQYAQQQAMLKIQKDFLTQQAQIDDAHNKGGSNAVYDADTAALRDATAEKVKITQDGYAQMKAAQGDWSNGLTQAYQNFQTTADNTAAQVGATFNTFTTGLTDDLVNFAMTGKTSFSGLATSVIKDMLKMEVQAAESKIFGLIQAMVGSIGGMGGGEIVASPISATSGVTSTPIAHSGDIAGMNSSMRGVNSSLFSGASRYHTGGIVDGEVPIIAQKGEAVMPTVRMSDGTLGIKAAGGGGGGTTNVVQVPVTLTVQYSGGSGGSGAGSNDHKEFANTLSDQLANVMDERINKWAADQTRPGGALSGAQKNRMGG